MNQYLLTGIIATLVGLLSVPKHYGTNHFGAGKVSLVTGEALPGEYTD